MAGRAFALAAVSGVGAEFQVNTYTLNGQGYPAVASDSAGNFVVVWQSYRQPEDGSGYGVFAQRFASNGAPIGTEFQVNTYTYRNQTRPSVAADSAGDFVVVWQSLYQDGDLYGVFGQRFASSGARLGAEFQVNTYTTDYQRDPAVASDSVGNFVVVWQSRAQDRSDFGVFGQRFASNGAQVGTEFQVNTYTPNAQRYPAVASDAAGDFVVAWQSPQDGSDYGVFSQRFASTGARLGAEFQVNSFTFDNQAKAAVASGSAGNFVIVWQSHNQDGSDYGVFGQRYTSNGTPLGQEFQINTFTPDNQINAAVASDAAGDFVVAWASYRQDGSSFGVFGQRFLSTGAPLGTEFLVETYTVSEQNVPSVASSSTGNFVVAWQSRHDGDELGVFARLFATPIVPGPAPVLGWHMLGVLAAALGLFAARILNRRRRSA